MPRSRSLMDWQGQKITEQLMQLIIVAFAVIAFATGYLMASFQMMILIYAGGVVLTTLVTVPNWPFFNHHPLKWLDPSELEKHPKPQPSPNVSSKKKSNFVYLTLLPSLSPSLDITMYFTSLDCKVVVLVLLELLVGNLFIAFLSTGSVLAVTLNIFQRM
ncbi:putative signal peptidase complex subunit 1 [Glycine max]|nr:putative signal peptidase complex subunit 1 [Glycine max]